MHVYIYMCAHRCGLRTQIRFPAGNSLIRDVLCIYMTCRSARIYFKQIARPTRVSTRASSAKKQPELYTVPPVEPHALSARGRGPPLSQFIIYDEHMYIYIYMCDLSLIYLSLFLSLYIYTIQ